MPTNKHCSNCGESFETVNVHNSAGFICESCRNRAQTHKPVAENRARERVVILAVFGGIVTVLVVVLGLVGTGIWFAVNSIEQARVEREELAVQEAQQRQEEEDRRRTAKAEEEARQRTAKAEEEARRRIARAEQEARLRSEEENRPKPLPPTIPPPPPIPQFPRPNPPLGRPEFKKPIEAPEPPPPPLPTFKEPANPYKSGTQTKLRELRSIALPKLPTTPMPKEKLPSRFETSSNYTRLAYSPQHQLLFVMAPKTVWVYDLK